MTPSPPLQVQLREIDPSDLAVFFEQQRDPAANVMAAFTSQNPYDRQAFDAHWTKVLADPKIVVRTILYGENVAGYVLHHSWFGDPEVSYWLGREFWGQGIATAALDEFVHQQALRPLFGRVAKDNIASRRVLEKCCFVYFGEDKGFSNARGEEVEELIFVLKG